MFGSSAALSSSYRADFRVYKQRNPAASHYFKCVSAHWEELEPAWDDLYQPPYGFFRSYVREVMLRFLACGDLHNGFARVRCPECGHEYLLAGLSRCAWKVLGRYLQHSVPYDDAVPGGTIELSQKSPFF